jgi:putative addiction module component (TIGR02574 family)
MDIQAEKALLIERFDEITEIEIIRFINGFLDIVMIRKNNESSEEYELSDEQKLIIDQRLEAHKEHPEDVVSLEEVRETVKNIIYSRK